MTYGWNGESTYSKKIRFVYVEYKLYLPFICAYHYLSHNVFKIRKYFYVISMIILEQLLSVCICERKRKH